MTTPSNKPKGFAGLEDMASVIDVPTPPPSPAPAPFSSESMIGSNAQEQSGTRGKPFEVDESRIPPMKPKGSNGWKWVFGFFGGLMVIGMISAALDSGKPKSSPNYSSPSYSTPSTPTPAYQAPPPPQTYEERPPVGSGLSFSDDQIRYCLSQDLRLNAWKENVNQYSQTAIDSFNYAVADYNSRCSNYRYRRGALERVRADVEQHHYLLQAEGASLATRNP